MWQERPGTCSLWWFNYLFSLSFLFLFLLLLLFFLSAQYALQLYGYLKAWRKNPHCSFSCCLAFLLPLNDLQGEVRGMAGKNVLKGQLQSGHFEMITFPASVKNSGAIDFTLEDGEEVGDEHVQGKDKNRVVARCKKKRQDQETQTEFLVLHSCRSYVMLQEAVERHA